MVILYYSDYPDYFVTLTTFFTFHFSLFTFHYYMYYLRLSAPHRGIALFPNAALRSTLG